MLTRPNVQFCLGNGVLTGDEVAQWQNAIEADPRTARLAELFGYTLPQTAEYAQDAAIVFVRLALLEGSNAAYMLVASQMADAGWDAVADADANPHMWDLYVRFCHRLADAMGRARYVPLHSMLTEAQRIIARETDALGTLRERMTALDLPHIPVHWMVLGACGDGACHIGSCEVHRPQASSGQLVGAV